MKRITLPLTLAICSFTVVTAAHADKTHATTATATSTAAPANESTAAPAGRKHHEWIPEKKLVLSLSSLDEDQKSKIEAIYEKNREAFNAIQKQKRALQSSEWESIKPILKPDQITSLSTRPQKAPPGAAKPQTAPLDKGEAK